MEILSQIIDYIARTNLFNFAIFLAIIILLVKKANVSQKLEESAADVATEIETSNNAKVESEERLHTIEDSLANIGDEIDEILKKSEESAANVGQKIQEDTEKTLVVISDNTEKSIENSRSVLKNDILKRASLASIEVAKSHIINELNSNQGLHDKLIDESIDAIEGVEL